MRYNNDSNLFGEYRSASDYSMSTPKGDVYDNDGELIWDQSRTNMTLGIGTGAIQKIANGQLYGKYAKAVRKYLATKGINGKQVFSSDIIGMARINDGKNTIQAVIRDMNLPTKNAFDNRLKWDHIVSKNLGYVTRYKDNNMALKTNSAFVDNITVRHDFPKQNPTMHELGHVVYNKTNPKIDDIKFSIKDSWIGDKPYHKDQSEIFSEAFSISKGYPIANKTLGLNATKYLENNNGLFDKYNVNIYPKNYPVWKGNDLK